MTFVGKILVIIIMVFAIVFLTISTVVFTTSTNWKDEAAKNKTEIQTLNEQVNTTKAETENLTGELAKTKRSHETVLAQFEADRASLEAQSKQRQGEITEQRQLLETALQNTKVAVQEAEARKQETDTLRGQLSAVQQQANEFKLRQTELNDQIRILQRELDVAKTNNKDLRETVALYQNVLQENGLDANVASLRGRNSPPPAVDGEVTRVAGNWVELSLGSDDGLVEGHTLFVYRPQGPDSGYIGKVKLQLVDPDTATGKVEGQTRQGTSIREGDHVATQIRPRS